MWQYARVQRRRHPVDVYAYLMAFQTVLQFLQQHRTPPVTLALIAVNVAVHFRPGPLDEILPLTSQVCLNPAAFVQTWDWKRLVLSAFYHADDTHLIYNMISLLWKGMDLEAQLGSTRFATATGALLLLSHSLFVLAARILSDILDIHDPFYRECAVGFSAVLFGFKTLLNASQPTYSHIGGFLLPTKYAAWAELFLIQMLVPRASFLGHLCGILAGGVLLYTPRVLHAPLSLFSLLRALQRQSPFRRHRFWGSGRTGTRGSVDSAHGSWACRICTYHNRLEDSECEMCGASLDAVPEGRRERAEERRERGEAEAPSAPPWEDRAHPESTSAFGATYETPGSAHDAGRLSQEELRRRRLSRFQQR